MSDSVQKSAVPLEQLLGTKYWPALPAYLVSTCDSDGKPHVAPFSLVTFSSYTAVAENPATPLIASVIIGDYDRYDEVQNSTTYSNLRSTGSFVINIPSAAIVDKVNRAGAPHPDKFAVCGLTPEESSEVVAPSVAECAVSLECNLEAIENRRWLGETIHGRVAGLRVAPEIADAADAEARMGALEPVYHYAFDHVLGLFYGLGEMILEEGKGE